MSEKEAKRKGGVWRLQVPKDPPSPPKPPIPAPPAHYLQESYDKALADNMALRQEVERLKAVIALQNVTINAAERRIDWLKDNVPHMIARGPVDERLGGG